MKSDDLLELFKWLGIVWGGYVSAVVLVNKWFSVLPEKWREMSVGRTAMIRMEKKLEDTEDRFDDEVKDIKKSISDHREHTTENFLKVIEISKR